MARRCFSLGNRSWNGSAGPRCPERTGGAGSALRGSVRAGRGRRMGRATVSFLCLLLGVQPLRAQLQPDECVLLFIGVADELMYQAKRGGKNRGCFRTLHDAFPVDWRESDGGTVKARATALLQTASQRTPRELLRGQFQRIARRLNQHTAKRFLDARKQPRQEWIVPCRLAALAGAALECEPEDACVRNVSTGGMGILTTRPMVRGQPAEVAILDGDHPKLFVAGLVAFCRHIEGVVYEVGLQLFTHSEQPILSRDPVSASRNLDWLAGAGSAVRSPAPKTTHVSEASDDAHDITRFDSSFAPSPDRG
jgi:hypothetical protein